MPDLQRQAIFHMSTTAFAPVSSEESSYNMTWLVSEVNQTWAVPKRAKFIVGGKQEDVDDLLKELNMDLKFGSDVRLEAAPVRVYLNVKHYRNCEMAYVAARMKEEEERRARAMFRQ